MRISPGDTAPDFSLPDQHGRTWTLSDHRGGPVVLYFYPRDNTSGCTAQACDVRDNWGKFGERGAQVVGISPDDAATHAAFADEHGLPQTLLADPDRMAIEAYGAWGEKTRDGTTVMGVLRCSVIIDPEGRVAEVLDSLVPQEQSSRALAALAAMQGRPASSP